MNYRSEVCHVPDENSIVHYLEVYNCRDIGNATKHRHQYTVDNESRLLAKRENNTNLQHEYRTSYYIIYKLTINHIIIITEFKCKYRVPK